jgi:hypothetical protein
LCHGIVVDGREDGDNNHGKSHGQGTNHKNSSSIPSINLSPIRLVKFM